jgi:hypothetical protein
MVCVSFDANLARPKLRRAKPSHAFRELSLAQIRFALDDERVWLRDFEVLSRVLASVPVYELERPRDLRSLASCLELAAGVLKTENGGADPWL